MAAAVYLGMEHCFSFLFSFYVCVCGQKKQVPDVAVAATEAFTLIGHGIGFAAGN